MIDKLQQLRGNGKLKICQNISDYYDEMGYKGKSNTFQFEKVFWEKSQKELKIFIMRYYY